MTSIEQALAEATARANFYAGRASALAEVKQSGGATELRGQEIETAPAFGFARALKEEA